MAELIVFGLGFLVGVTTWYLSGFLWSVVVRIFHTKRGGVNLTSAVVGSIVSMGTFILLSYCSIYVINIISDSYYSGELFWYGCVSAFVLSSFIGVVDQISLKINGAIYD
jgi:hypothetical protein